MVPSFDPEGGPALVLLRAGADAGLLSSFGALLALAWLAPAVLAVRGVAASPVRRALRRVAAWSLLAAIVLSAGWLVGESVDMAGTAAATGVVLQATLFGHLVAARVTMLVLAGMLLGVGRHWAACLVAATAVASQAGHDHAWAMSVGAGGARPSVLLLSNIAHLLAAGAWLGGLVPLLLLVSAAPPAAATLACRRFSVLGSVCVAVLAGTALFQGSVMAGSWSGLFGTAYGWVLCTKLALFLLLIGLAARNRYRLTPALDADGGGTPLLRSIGLETAAGLAIVLAAALLTSLQPGMAM